MGKPSCLAVRTEYTPYLRVGKLEWCKFVWKNYGFFGFPSPPRDGCPNRVVRLRERGREQGRLNMKTQRGGWDE